VMRFFIDGSVEKACPESDRRVRRACAGAPGLRSQSYFGGVGWADRPAAFPVFAGVASRLRTEALRRVTSQTVTLLLKHQDSCGLVLF
jgi:hypothetical protein